MSITDKVANIVKKSDKALSLSELAGLIEGVAPDEAVSILSNSTIASDGILEHKLSNKKLSYEQAYLRDVLECAAGEIYRRFVHNVLPAQRVAEIGYYKLDGNCYQFESNPNKILLCESYSQVKNRLGGIQDG